MLRYILLSIFCLAATSMARAQLPPAGESYWSVRGGVAMSRMASDDYLTAYHTGFSLGVNYALAISTQAPFYFESGLGFSRRGGDDYGYIGGDDMVYQMQSYSVDIPFSLLCRVNLTHRAAMLLNFGGYLSVAVAGRVDSSNFTFDPYRESVVLTRSYNAAEPTTIFHRFDSGIRYGFSFCLSRVEFNFNVSLGMVNLFSGKLREEGYQLKSKSMNLLVGYIF
ncbi:MAG: outer membrane beta-barrel protein [Rikenellaceae bacterium]